MPLLGLSLEEKKMSDIIPNYLPNEAWFDNSTLDNEYND